MADSIVFSVVVPAFNEAENIPHLLDAVAIQLEEQGTFEIVVVDDGSTDKSLEVLREAAVLRPYLRYLSFSRNFGHQAALRAGLLAAVGECVISMDADFQHPPEFIPTMVGAWRDGAEIVVTLREQQQHLSWSKRATSAGFYKLMGWLSDVEFQPGAADFRLLDRKAVETIRSFDETELFFRGVMPLIGFKTVTLSYRLAERKFGESKYTLRKMLKLALSGSINVSTKPLRLASALAFVVMCFAAVYGVYALIAATVFRAVEPGWASLIMVVLVLGGMQLFVLGIIGEYVAQILREARHRPAFIVRETERTYRLSHPANVDRMQVK